MTWQLAEQFALWAGALLIALLVVLFCVAGVVAVWEDYIRRRVRFGSQYDAALAQERADRKHQTREIRIRLRKLEEAMRETNPGLNI